MTGRIRWQSAILSLLLVFAAERAFAQIDLTGGWMSLVHEDIAFRNDAPDATARATEISGAGGPQIGNYTGLPVNDAARSALTAGTRACRTRGNTRPFPMTPRRGGSMALARSASRTSSIPQPSASS